MDTMSKRELQMAAMALVDGLHAPAGKVSVRSDTQNGDVRLCVSLAPSIAHLEREVPRTWRGLEVTTQVAKLPKAK